MKSGELSQGLNELSVFETKNWKKVFAEMPTLESGITESNLKTAAPKNADFGCKSSNSIHISYCAIV